MKAISNLSMAPGLLITAAFVGPGTVATCILAGANFGYSLVWALLFATVATVVFQDMTARLGVGARLGLGEALLTLRPSGWLRWLLVGLVFTALGLGNAAFEGGNLAGAAIGLELLLGLESGAGGVSESAIIGLSAFALGLLLWGGVEWVQRVLVVLVLLMSLSFVAAMVLVKPDIADFLHGLRPQLPTAGALTALALVGTTIVPYNLFLHAALARRRWDSQRSVQSARMDSALSISLGGLVSISILACAAGAVFAAGLEITSAKDLVQVLEPTYGTAARWLLGGGLFAAGLTSALTAPLATGFVAVELSGNTKSPSVLLRAVAAVVVMFGAGINLLGIAPLALIVLAQVANALLLPIIALALLVVMNRRALLGDQVNGTLANLFGVAVLLLCMALSLRSLFF